MVAVFQVPNTAPGTWFRPMNGLYSEWERLLNSGGVPEPVLCGGGSWRQQFQGDQSHCPSNTAAPSQRRIEDLWLQIPPLSKKTSEDPGGGGVRGCSLLFPKNDIVLCRRFYFLLFMWRNRNLSCFWELSLLQPFICVSSAERRMHMWKRKIPLYDN